MYIRYIKYGRIMVKLTPRVIAGYSPPERLTL